MRADYVEVTIRYEALSTAAGKEASLLFDPEKGPPRVPSIVHTDFDKQPLSEAMEELPTRRAQHLIDPRVGDGARRR